MDYHQVRINFENTIVSLPSIISGAELKKMLNARRLRIRIGALCREINDNDKLNLEVSKKKIVFEEF